MTEFLATVCMVLAGTLVFVSWVARKHVEDVRWWRTQWYLQQERRGYLERRLDEVLEERDLMEAAAVEEITEAVAAVTEVPA